MDDMRGFPVAGVPVLQSPATGCVTIDGGTASALTSLLMDLQVGGVSKASVMATGLITAEFGIQVPSGSSASLPIRLNDSQTGLYRGATQGGIAIIITCATTPVFAVGQNSGVGVVNIGPYSFASAISGTADVLLYRDAADTLAQRRTTNAQTYRIYNTWTDASNYERLSIGWSGNVCTIAPEAAGTGTLRGLNIGAAASLIGLFGATPIVQPVGAGQAVVTLGNADSEIGGLTISAAYDQTEVQALRDKCEELADDVRALSTLVHGLRTALVNLGAIKGAA